MSDDVTEHVDDFRGDNAALVASIDALLHLDDAKALVPHGLGGPSSHAYRLLCAAKHRLSTPLAESNKGMRETLTEARNAPMIDHSGQKRGVYDVLDRLIAATPSPDSGERMREAGYVAGPVYRSSMEPEGDVWSAEIQVIGGHYVAAEVYGSTEDEARARQSVILAALHESAR